MISEENYNKAYDISNNLQSAAILLDKLFDSHNYKDADIYHITWLVEKVTGLSIELHKILSENPNLLYNNSHETDN